MAARSSSPITSPIKGKEVVCINALKTVKITSEFPAAAPEIWSRLTKVETLQYIAAPYATFEPLSPADANTWSAGSTRHYRLNIFRIIPIGVHTIHVRKFDEAAHYVFTEESNRRVPAWNHTITIEPIHEHKSRYTDIVEIDAGLLTGLVCFWSKLFYRHRQKKWIELLSSAS